MIGRLLRFTTDLYNAWFKFAVHTYPLVIHLEFSCDFYYVLEE